MEFGNAIIFWKSATASIWGHKQISLVIRAPQIAVRKQNNALWQLQFSDFSIFDYWPLSGEFLQTLQYIYFNMYLQHYKKMHTSKKVTKSAIYCQSRQIGYFGNRFLPFSPIWRNWYWTPSYMFKSIIYPKFGYPGTPGPPRGCLIEVRKFCCFDSLNRRSRRKRPMKWIFDLIWRP